MKRGPNHSKKTAEFKPSPAQVAFGIPEIAANILHYYPRYGRRGLNNITTVSKSLHKAIKEMDFSDEPTFEKLIADCLKNPEGVIHILSDDTLLPYLTKEQILKLISCHGEFAIYLLENDFIPIAQEYEFNLVNLFKKGNLRILTKHHPQVAMHLFTNPKWFEKIQHDVHKFGCQHLEIAHYILDNNIIMAQRLDKLKMLAESSVAIARRLLNDPAIFEDLTERDLKGPKFLYQYLELLIETAKTNESLGFLPSGINTPNDFVNQFEALCDLGLTKQEVHALGEYHSEIAMKVLKSEVLSNKYLESGVPLSWRENHQAVAMCLLEAKTLDVYRVTDLCKSHPAAVEYVFKDDDLCKLMCDYACDINFASGILPLDKMAMHILKSPVFCEKLDDDALSKLGKHDPQAAKVILTTKKFNTKLSEGNMHLMCYQHPHITNQIFKTQSLLELVNPEHLALLEVEVKYGSVSSLVDKISKQAKCWDLQTNKPREEMDIDVVAKSTLKK